MIRMATSEVNIPIHRMPEGDRPRERLQKCGPNALSTAELMAVLLGSGMRGKSVLQLSQEILAHFGGLENLAQATFSELKQIKGLGPTKALQLMAVFALGNKAVRQSAPTRPRVDSPAQAYELVKDQLEEEKRELCVAILLDIKGWVICQEVVSIGTLSNALVHPREVFYPAIRHKAARLVVAHNHPSGDPTPSTKDIDITRTLIEASGIIGIPLADHIIVGRDRFVSLRQRQGDLWH